MAKIQTKSQVIAADVAALLRARNPLLWIVTREEARVERYLFEAAASVNYVSRTWDIAQGVADMAGNIQGQLGDTQDPGAAFDVIRSRANGGGKGDRGVWIMRDLPVWISGPTGAQVLRKLRNLARALPSIPREYAQAIIVITPSAELPPELMGHATVIEWPIPDRTEIAAILDAAIASLTEEEMQKKAAPAGIRESAIDAAVGLSGEEAAACYARSLVQWRKIDVQTVAKEKKRVIAREGMLEWYDPLPGGLNSVGGLENLKAWLVARLPAYSQKAKAYGLPMPKGCLVVGVSGCGKSLLAKAAATAFGVPLLRIDLGALKSKFVGESESNLRKAFEVVAAIGRCILWFDEVEKSLQGATSGSADGGVSSDALGAILTWMQERSGEAFVIATANDVTSLPPEFLRKGRFDEVWYVDLPTETERVSVLSAALRAHGRDGAEISMGKVASACSGFTGSEIAAIVPDSMYVAFADGAREITTDDLLHAARSVVPLSKTAEEKITKLREWAKGRARPATSETPVVTKAKAQERELDL